MSKIAALFWMMCTMTCLGLMLVSLPSVTARWDLRESTTEITLRSANCLILLYHPQDHTTLARHTLGTAVAVDPPCRDQAVAPPVGVHSWRWLPAWRVHRTRSLTINEFVLPLYIPTVVCLLLLGRALRKALAQPRFVDLDGPQGNTWHGAARG